MMLSYLKDTILPSRVYNSLPLIEDNLDVPKNYAADLQVLRKLLVQHKVPSSINVRLIHRHYDAKDGEVMAFQTVKVPEGKIQVMRPIMAKNYAALHPIQYFVDKDKRLQAYEYTTDDIPAVNLQDYQPFLKDFCQAASERGLEHRFGLKIRDDGASSDRNWSEYEFPDKRSTVIIPKGLPRPDDDGSGQSVNTEWTSDSGSGPSQDGNTRPGHMLHCYSHCKSHCNKHGGSKGKSAGPASSGSSAQPPSRTCNSHCSKHPEDKKGSRGSDTDSSVTLVGSRYGGLAGPRGQSSKQICNSHCSKHPASQKKLGSGRGDDSKMVIGGAEVAEGTPFYRMMTSVMNAW